VPPRGLRARLTVAFLGTVAAALTLSGVLVVDGIDRELRAQEVALLTARREAVVAVVRSVALDAAAGGAVVRSNGTLARAVRNRFSLQNPELQVLATTIARADVRITFGAWDADKESFQAIPDGEFLISSEGIEATADEARAGVLVDPQVATFGGSTLVGAVEVRLESPLTTRVSRLREVTNLVILIGLAAMGLAIGLAALSARRFARPVGMLAAAATAIGDGDLSVRVPTGPEIAANDEMKALLEKFNLMASRLEATVRALRRERDRGQEHLADVSHELRTPLAALRAFVDLLADAGAADEATRKRLLDEAGRQLERMDALTANILELSRFDAGIARPVFVLADLRASVRAAIEQAAVAARRRGVAVEERLPARRVMVRHDAALVGQAVSNLVANALKFTPRGGIVAIEVQPLATGAARIVVRDSGVGISPDELPRIFDRFYRGTEGLAAAGTAARATGSGLGLSIVKSIVDMHAGRIVVESLVGTGTTFTLTLPIDPEATSAEPSEPPPSQASASLVSVGRRAAALLGEVAKTSLRLRRVLQAEPPSSTVEKADGQADAEPPAGSPTHPTQGEEHRP